MAKNKLKMSNTKFRVLHGIGIFLLAVVLLWVNVVGSLLDGLLETYIERGQTEVVTSSDTADWDATYYDVAYASADEAKEAAYAVAREVQNEGTVLLANNGVLPLAAGTTVRPFGYAYLNPMYGQTTTGGSAKMVKEPVTPEQGLAAFTIDSATVERMEGAEVVVTVEAPGTAVAGEAGSMLGGDCKLYEFDPSIYEGIETDPSAVGIVFITRSGQEGQDQKFDAYEDGTPHYLALSANERGAIQAAKESCGHVVVVLVASAPMEFGELVEGDLAVDAILWYGHPGDRGLAALSDILTGEVNPSGRTVDTWAADFTADPSYQALGTNTYTNVTTTSGSYTDGGEFNRTYNEYLEGVYMGYRYYETADAVDPSFDYDSAVVFPFGYGLSYTTFEKTLDSVVESDGVVTATVTVTNTGDVAGKDVVELYYSSPYTELDAQMGIEKPAAVLIQFDKTKLLEPGESQTITLSFDRDDMASYSYAHDNGNGTTGCYVLEAGDYAISLRENSHDVIDTATVAIDETIWFDGSDEAHVRKAERDMQSTLDAEGNPTGTTSDGSAFIAASNLFQTSTDYMTSEATILSRGDWAGTQPVGTDEKALGEEFIPELGIEISFDPATDPVLGNVEGSLVYAAEMPVSGADNGLTASDLRGAAYDDPRWELLLDQIDWDADRKNIITNFSGDAYQTRPIDSIGLPGTTDEDGANGLKVPGGPDGGYDLTASSSTGFAPLLASTWNRELAYELGAAFGQEGLVHGIQGWYCPAINLHRSAFCGRVFEYYSEDPVLSGWIAASAVSGAGDQGMFCYLKHFALNDTETGRSSLVLTWADEQTMRELYMRSFEIAVRNARVTERYSAEDGTVATRVMRGATAIMAAQNCVGTTVGECNYALLTSLLRGEWNFEGMVISDYWTWNGDNLRDLCVRAGCDTYLNMPMTFLWSVSDYDSPTARAAMRTAIHNTAYAVVNSAAMQGAAPGATFKVTTPSWQYLIWGVTAVCVLLIANAIRMIVKRGRDELAHPELYRRGKRAEAKLQKKLAKQA